MGKILKTLAVLAALGFPLAILGSQLNLYGFRTGFKILEYSFYLAGAILLAGLATSLFKRNSDPATSKSGLVAAIIACVPIFLMASIYYQAKQVPPIHNISTDVNDPPRFDKIKSLRTTEENPLAYDTQALADVQQQAYPQVKTLSVNLSSENAFVRAVSVAQSLGWEIVSQDQQAGIIEAIETTALWQFKDDIVIRIRSGEPSGSLIDLRSVSRVGQSDLGANAKRITAFLSRF